MIKAEIHSDDRKIEVEFDATAFFKQASDGELQRLADCDFRGDYPADDVGHFEAERNPEVQRVFDYLDIVRDQGFEVVVDSDDASAWLRKNRPALSSSIETQEGV